MIPAQRGPASGVVEEAGEAFRQRFGSLGHQLEAQRGFAAVDGEFLGRVGIEKIVIRDEMQLFESGCRRGGEGQVYGASGEG